MVTKKKYLDAANGMPAGINRNERPLVSLFLNTRSSNPQSMANTKKAPPVNQYNRTEMTKPTIARDICCFGAQRMNKIIAARFTIDAIVTFK